MTLASGELDFLCLGAQKCATSALTVLLGEHPGLFVPQHTAPFFETKAFRRGLPWLLETAFAGAGQSDRLGAVNPRLMMGRADVSIDTLADRILATAPGVRFLVIVRDPIERAVSQWRMDRRRGRATGTFAEEALRPPRDPAMGEHNLMIRTGLYGRALQPYAERFDADRFLVITTEDLAGRGAETLARVYAHLGVDPAFAAPSVDRRVHESGTGERMSRESARILLGHLDDHWFAQLAEPERRQTRAAFRFWFERFNVVPDDELPEIPGDVRTRLVETFLPDAEVLARVAGRLPPWARRDPTGGGALMWCGR